jgi:hypothetical protein
MDSVPEPMSVGEAWFRQARALRESASDPGEMEDDIEDDDLVLAGLPTPGGGLGWAFVLGGIGGGIGGAAMMFAAAAAARRLHVDVDVVRTIGRTVRVLPVDPHEAGMGLAIVLGVVVGVLFGALLRYSRRFIARLVAAPLLAAVLWTLVHAFLFKSFAPHSLGALPFAPMVIGAAVYGLCIAILRPPRPRRRIAGLP